MKSLGGIVFIVGLVLAAIIAIIGASTTPQWAVMILALLGLLVGLLNITDKEVQLFLVASIAFLISFSALGNVLQVLSLGWNAIATFFWMMNVFVAPAAGVVAIKAIVKAAKD